MTCTILKSCCLQAMWTVDCWLLVWTDMICQGCNTALSNNLGQIVQCEHTLRSPPPLAACAASHSSHRVPCGLAALAYFRCNCAIRWPSR